LTSILTLSNIFHIIFSTLYQSYCFRDKWWLLNIICYNRDLDFLLYNVSHFIHHNYITTDKIGYLQIQERNLNVTCKRSVYEQYLICYHYLDISALHFQLRWQILKHRHNKLNVDAAHQRHGQMMWTFTRNLENRSLLQLNIRSTNQFFSMFLVCARFAYFSEKEEPNA
jgi:hypothetical protein